MRGFGQHKLWCHLSLDTGEKFTNLKIRKSKALNVNTFKDLVLTVARIANHNPDYSLYFRGQKQDYKHGDISSFYPTIFRSNSPLSKNKLTERYRILGDCSERLLDGLSELNIEQASKNKIKKFQELQWSILQHYEICDTPLLDVTHSLRVAASFALKDTDKSAVAYIFIFAFPYPNGTITYSTVDELLNIRLLNACPAEALRPHFQEGFLVGSFPSHASTRKDDLDFGRRLIAKIEIPGKEFWNENYNSIPRDALFPQEDAVNNLCLKIKQQLAQKKGG